MSAVLLSIHPRWVKRIFDGEKTIEVRRNKPREEPPFRCYVYETKGGVDEPWIDEDGHRIFKGRGMVVGEFVCEKIVYLFIEKPYTGREFPGTGLTDVELSEYLDGSSGCGWCISDVKVYEEPKSISEFKGVCLKDQCYERCSRYGKGCEIQKGLYPIKSVPQSWMYVEGKE